jgi:hypothetical protein
MDLSKNVGNGSYADVYKIMAKDSKKYFAAKIYKTEV